MKQTHHTPLIVNTISQQVNIFNSEFQVSFIFFNTHLFIYLFIYCEEFIYLKQSYHKIHLTLKTTASNVYYFFMCSNILGTFY